MVSTDTKPCILVVMHFTIDPDYVVPDSRRFVRETGMVVVDCLFSETSGLLVCSKNNAARRTIMENLKKHAKVSDGPCRLSLTFSNGGEHSRINLGTTFCLYVCLNAGLHCNDTLISCHLKEKHLILISFFCNFSIHC